MSGQEKRASQNAVHQISYLSRRTTLFSMPRWREMASAEKELETFPDTRVDKVQRVVGVERVDIAPSTAPAATRDATAMFSHAQKRPRNIGQRKVNALAGQI